MWNISAIGKIWKYSTHNLTNKNTFRPIEAVGRVSESQLQVSKNSK